MQSALKKVKFPFKHKFRFLPILAPLELEIVDVTHDQILQVYQLLTIVVFHENVTGFRTCISHNFLKDASKRVNTDTYIPNPEFYI